MPNMPKHQPGVDLNSPVWEELKEAQTSTADAVRICSSDNCHDYLERVLGRNRGAISTVCRRLEIEVTPGQVCAAPTPERR